MYILFFSFCVWFHRRCVLVKYSILIFGFSTFCFQIVLMNCVNIIILRILFIQGLVFESFQKKLFVFVPHLQILHHFVRHVFFSSPFNLKQITGWVVEGIAIQWRATIGIIGKAWCWRKDWWWFSPGGDFLTNACSTTVKLSGVHVAAPNRWWDHRGG